MPNRYTHEKISELLLGNPCSETHEAIDRPVKRLGPAHREFYHDPLSAYLIGFSKNGYKGGISGILHITADRYVNNQIKKDTVKYWLKLLEHARRRKK
jgi:hypothetical protein